MRFLGCLSLMVLLVLYADSISADQLGACAGGGYCKEADFKTIGCYKDKMSDRALPYYIYNERDPTTSNFGNRFIEWFNWNNYMPGFACRCAAKAKAMGYDIIGVQFWGECWAGKISEHNAKRHGASNACFGHSYKACQTNERFCAGDKEASMVYQLVDMACSVDFEPVGCYRDHHGDNRPLGDYILSDRDTSVSVSSGINIDWVNWDTYMPEFACRCAKKAQESGNTFFGTQFYGECWSHSNGQNTFAIDGKVTSCTDRCYRPCKNNEDMCIGGHYTNYVYRVKGACEVTIAEVGCYVENPDSRLLGDLVVTMNNPLSDQFYGKLRKEQAWGTMFPDFLCKCARLAKAAGHSKIGVSNKGDCYANVVNDNYSQLGNSTACYHGDDSTVCVSGQKKCAGSNAQSSYIYSVA